MDNTSAAGARGIHLLYVPTMACNLHCSYCYLGGQTTMESLAIDAERSVSTLSHTIKALESAGVVAFNISLHGGEVTMLPAPVLDELFTIIRRYYLKHFDTITALGHRKSAPHIKTNLYRFASLYDLFNRHKVSISASIDLPLDLHDRYRRTRGGTSWRERTEKHLRLLGDYPHAKKISATFSSEHLADIPALISDIRYIHGDLGFDMNNFNIMFAFPSAFNAQEQGNHTLPPATPADHIALYTALHEEFRGTELEEGLRRRWFEEFTPSYCTNSINCGERFFLLQGDGSVYSCVRGQGIPEFRYGNVFDDPIETILARGASAIAAIHQRYCFDEACQECGYLALCHTGCPVVKFQYATGRSYTCDLQKIIYQDNPRCYPESSPTEQAEYARFYALEAHPRLTIDDGPFAPQIPPVIVPVELADTRNGLRALIAADPILTQLYREDAWIIEINDERFPLLSQITKTDATCHTLIPDDRIRIHLRRELLSVACSEPIRNTIYIQMLRDTPVVYGDDKRAKQEHLFTYQLYSACLHSSDLGEEWAMVDLSDLISQHRSLYHRGIRNNMFVTTGYLRDYHYQKHKENAFYHIQAVNLPFQNFEFTYLIGERP